MRRELGHRMSLRYTPELQFIADDSIDRGSKLIKMMDELEQK
jgi:ribosome-binding factor A